MTNGLDFQRRPKQMWLNKDGQRLMFQSWARRRRFPLMLLNFLVGTNFLLTNWNHKYWLLMHVCKTCRFTLEIARCKKNIEKGKKKVKEHEEAILKLNYTSFFHNSRDVCEFMHRRKGLYWWRTQNIYFIIKIGGDLRWEFQHVIKAQWVGAR